MLAILFYPLFYLLYLSMPLYAQQEINFTTLNTKNGLSSNTVNTVIQDTRGLIWIGTADGLNKFDGTNFTTYTHNALNSNSIPSNIITCLLEDRSGRIWVGTSGGGLAYYTPKLDVFTVLNSDGAKRKQDQFNVKALYQDRDGRIWVGTFGGYRIIDPKTLKVESIQIKTTPESESKELAVLSFFEDKCQHMWVGTNNGLLQIDLRSKHKKLFLHDPSDLNSISDNGVRVIVTDRKGHIYFGTNKGLNLLMPDHKSFSHFSRSVQNKGTLAEDIIYSASLIPDGSLWIGTEDGVGVFDPQRKVFSTIRPDKRRAFSLSNKSIRSIYLANSGIIWLGTYQGGLNKYDPNLALFNLQRSSPFDPKGLSAPIVTSFAQLTKNGFFVGTDGGGLHYFHRETGLFDHITLKSRIDPTGSSLAILALELDREDKLWVGTYQNGLFLYDHQSGKTKHYLSDQHGISQNDIFFVKQDSRGLVWIGTNGKGVNVYDPKNDKFSRYFNNGTGKYRLPLNGFMRSIAEDAQGNIWLGSNGTGLAVLDRKTSEFRVYNHANSALSDDVVFCILHDLRGNTWVGTNGGGINLLAHGGRKFIHLDESSGLANGIVYKILQDQNGMIWLTTDNGISSIDPHTKKIVNFGRSNGVQQSPFLVGSGLIASDGSLFFGGQDGFNYFTPSTLPPRPAAPKVILTELKVSNNLVSPGPKSPITEQIGYVKKILLDYGQNFSISFAALNFSTPHQTHYAYRLQGLDKDWNNVGQENTAYYTNLDPGEYIFQVRASSSEGKWSAQLASVAVHIEPPFWRSLYAYGFYGIMIAAALFYSRHQGIQKIKNALAIEQGKIDAQREIDEHRLEAQRMHALDNQKIKFLTNLSHEFRTPISLILAPVDKLVSSKLDPSVASQVKMINRNARRLLNLVNQLLDFRKMEERELRLNLEKTDLVAFVYEAAESFRDLSDRKKISFLITSSISQLETLFDPEKMERIIFNLLSNAFKFTQEGGRVALGMHLEGKPGEDNWKLILSIKDDGVGIPNASRDQVFDRFFTDNSQGKILNQGSGIGLSIVREFVELHGGEIALESEEGKGTAFVISFPVQEKAVVREMSIPQLDQSDLPAGFGIKSINPNSENRPTILLVEDNEEYRSYLKDALSDRYHIIEAANGREGWQKSLSAHPHLVVSDVQMPEMNGIILSQKIKGDKRTNHIPVILLTAMIAEDEQIRGLQSGANDYLTKPFNFEILNTKIKNLLLYNSSLKDVYSRQVKLEGSTMEVESSEVKFLTKVVQYIDQKLNDPELSVEDLSKHVGMSRGSLYHRILAITGLSPIEYIRSVKLDRALELLEKSDLNVAQIAYMTGFGTPSYFSRLFKSRYHQLPSEYLLDKRKVRK